MAHRTIDTRWLAATLLGVLGLCVAMAPTADAARPGDPDGGFGPNDRPVYLIISLTDDFDLPVVERVNGSMRNSCDEMGSQTIVVPIGTYVAGQDIGDTRYEGDDLTTIDLNNLPPDPATGLPLDPETLDMNQTTIVGSFCTFGGEVHLVTPDPAPILPPVQEAFFNASPFFGELSEYPTTVEIAYFIYERQGSAGAEFQDILNSVFSTSMVLNCTTCFAEGDLFPHEPTDDVLFTFELQFDTDNGDFMV
ncbi:MAG: hypothetical protein ACYTG6_15445, partial [Planctomycetota bacterium]